MDSVYKKFLDLLFPPRCPFCKAVLKDNETLLCGHCRKTLPWTPETAQKHKFGGVSVYAPKYASLMAECIGANGLQFDLIAWAPLGPKRLKKRGYDQAKLLAQELSARFEKPSLQLLYKPADNPPQSGTSSARERKTNVAGVYRVTDPVLAAAQRVLLVDDIVTTGASLDECARVLKAAGAKSVCAATLARSRMG